MFLPDLIEYLERKLNGFADEQRSTKRFIAKIVYLPRTHYQDETAVSISESFIREMGHSPALFKRVNDKYKLYTSQGGYVKNRYSRKWYANPIVTQIMHGFTRDKETTQIQELFKGMNGKYCMRTAVYIANASTVVGGLTINPSPNVNTVEFDKYMAQYNIPEHHKATGERVRALLQASNFPEGVIPQAYRQVSSGRVAGLGVAIQSLPRDMRQALMTGYYEYDISNCHYTILSQTGSYPTISNYVAHTKQWRQELAAHLDITLDQAKRCLLAMSYGATKGTNSTYCAIPALIGEDKTQAFWQHPKVVALDMETRLAGAYLTGLSPTDKTLPSTVAHTLQRLENDILAAATKDIVITVPVYDGFIYDEELDINQLQMNVKELTGYDVVIEGGRI